MEWNSQQDKALKDVDRWFYSGRDKSPIYRVFGFAGTGKSTIARHFAENIDGQVAYAAFTGKAALVMRNNGCNGASTIHSLIYKVIQDKNTKKVSFVLDRESSLRDAALLVVDECSMVDEKIGRDLLSFQVPILVLGDPAQLPPPSGAGFFTNKKPDNMLTEIHRQSKDNPIIYMSTMVREGNKLKLGTYGESRILEKIVRRDAINADQIIVGRNATRSQKNFQLRKLLGRGDSVFPIAEDKLICLRNDSSLGIYNGGLFNVDSVNHQLSGAKSKFLHMSLNSEDSRNGSPTMVKVPKALFSGDRIPPNSTLLKNSQQFDYGYAITCHKSQGSQWDNVLIYDESWCFRDDWARWLYTAITRAADKVTLVRG